MRKDQNLTEKPKMAKTSLNLPEDLWKAAKIRAIELDVDLQDLLAEALRDYLRKGGAK